MLNLERWSEPAIEDRRGHLKRAFCCTVLIRAGADPESQGYIDAENDTLATLVASVRVLGPAFTREALRLVSWRALNPDVNPEEYPFFLFAVLLLCIDLDLHHHVPACLQEVMECTLTAEAEVRQKYADVLPDDSSQWLLGLTFFDQRHAVWKALGQAILLHPRSPHPANVAATLAELGRRLYGYI